MVKIQWVGRHQILYWWWRCQWYYGWYRWFRYKFKKLTKWIKIFMYVHFMYVNFMEKVKFKSLNGCLNGSYLSLNPKPASTIYFWTELGSSLGSIPQGNGNEDPNIFVPLFHSTPMDLDPIDDLAFPLSQSQAASSRPASHDLDYMREFEYLQRWKRTAPQWVFIYLLTFFLYLLRLFLSLFIYLL